VLPKDRGRGAAPSAPSVRTPRCVQACRGRRAFARESVHDALLEEYLSVGGIGFGGADHIAELDIFRRVRHSSFLARWLWVRRTWSAFHDELPRDCPPADAKATTQTIYRGVRRPPLSAADFVSVAEERGVRGDKSNCQCWGLSVWISREAAEHGRKVLPFMRKWHVASGEIEPADGLLLKTPSNSQPDHFTFWKCVGASLERKFEIVLYPN
jgi:hypothetical protein